MTKKELNLKKDTLRVLAFDSIDRYNRKEISLDQLDSILDAINLQIGILDNIRIEENG